MMRGSENSEQRSQELPAVAPLRVVASPATRRADLDASLRSMLESCPVPPELLARIEAACAPAELRDAS